MRASSNDKFTKMFHLTTISPGLDSSCLLKPWRNPYHDHAPKPGRSQCATFGGGLKGDIIQTLHIPQIKKTSDTKAIVDIERTSARSLFYFLLLVEVSDVV